MGSIKIKPNVKKLMEMYIYQCEKCGRIARYFFYPCHATNKHHLFAETCDGKVKRIKFKNAW